MRAIAAALLLSLLWSSAPALMGSHKPDCCKDERHCAMHRVQGHGCRMGACQREVPTVVAVDAAILPHAKCSAQRIDCDIAWMSMRDAARWLRRRPLLPPPRA